MRIRQYLFILLLFDIFIVIWGLILVAQTFLINYDQLIFPEENIRLLLILFILFAISSLGGLIISILYGKRKYTRNFAILQVIVFIAMLSGKSIFG